MTKEAAFIPVGAELKTSDGALIARVARPMYSHRRPMPDDFGDWRVPKPAMGEIIPPEIVEALNVLARRYFGEKWELWPR